MSLVFLSSPGPPLWSHPRDVVMLRKYGPGSLGGTCLLFPAPHNPRPNPPAIIRVFPSPGTLGPPPQTKAAVPETARASWAFCPDGTAENRAFPGTL